MRNLGQLRGMLSDLTQEFRNARGLDPSTSDLNDQINWAYRTIAAKCFLVGDNQITLTANQSLYNLRDGSCMSVQVIRPIKVFIQSSTTPGYIYPLWDASQKQHGFWTVDELDQFYPTRKTDPGGMPFAAAKESWNKLLLYPTPDSTTAALSGHSVYGVYLPADLVLDTDIPDLPDEIQEAIAWLAAEYAVTPTMTGEDGFKKIEMYQQYWSQIIQATADQNSRTMSSWGSTSGYRDNDFLIL